MNDSFATDAQGAPDERRWLLLIHQVPPKPDYLRVKVRRRLQRLGAAALKSTVYALRDTEEALEDFQWLAREIRAQGGSAMLCRAAFVGGITDEEVEAMLHTESGESDADRPRATAERVTPGRVWVTRAGVFVDRIASAWLIRRFIDPEATFRFVRGRGETPRAGELRFDMYEAEYTHEGERCTFQTLLARFGLEGDRALRAIGEVVHDIDCKDEKYGRPETAGIASLIRGIAEAHDDDGRRIERGSAALDDLYAAFRKTRR